METETSMGHQQPAEWESLASKGQRCSWLERCHKAREAPQVASKSNQLEAS